MRHTIVLDLDETLISSVRMKDCTATDRHALHAYESATGIKPFSFLQVYSIYPRPGLDEFLDFVFAHFRVIVWTAGTRDYGWFILHHIILGKKQAERREHVVAFLSLSQCELSQSYSKNKQSPKHLAWLMDKHPEFQIDRKRTVFFDDNEEVHQVHRDVIVRVPKFEVLKASAANDHFLYDIQPVLHKRLKN